MGTEMEVVKMMMGEGWMVKVTLMTILMVATYFHTTHTAESGPHPIAA